MLPRRLNQAFMGTLIIISGQQLFVRKINAHLIRYREEETESAHQSFLHLLKCSYVCLEHITVLQMSTPVLWGEVK